MEVWIWGNTKGYLLLWLPEWAHREAVPPQEAFSQTLLAVLCLEADRGGDLVPIALPLHFLVCHFSKCNSCEHQEPDTRGLPCSGHNIPFQPHAPPLPSVFSATGLTRLVTFPENTLSSSPQGLSTSCSLGWFPSSSYVDILLGVQAQFRSHHQQGSSWPSKGHPRVLVLCTLFLPSCHGGVCPL